MQGPNTQVSLQVLVPGASSIVHGTGPLPWTQLKSSSGSASQSSSLPLQISAGPTQSPHVQPLPQVLVPVHEPTWHSCVALGVHHAELSQGPQAQLDVQAWVPTPQAVSLHSFVWGTVHTHAVFSQGPQAQLDVQAWVPSPQESWQAFVSVGAHSQAGLSQADHVQSSSHP